MLLRRIQRVKEKFEKDLLLFPNVVGIGIGPKTIKGKQGPNLCIKVYVTRKIPSQKLLKGSLVPAKLDGIPTDVEEIGAVKAGVLQVP